MGKRSRWLVFSFLIITIVLAIYSVITLTKAAAPVAKVHRVVETDSPNAKEGRVALNPVPMDSPNAKEGCDTPAPVPTGPEPFPTVELPDGKELYRFYVEQINEQYYPDVPVDLVMAIMKVESNYQPNAGSNAGAVGLMQVIPCYHQHRIVKYCLNDLWDPYTNILCAMDLLNERYEVRGNWRSALFDYNHSWAYVNHVLSTMNDISKGG